MKTCSGEEATSWIYRRLMTCCGQREVKINGVQWSRRGLPFAVLLFMCAAIPSSRTSSPVLDMLRAIGTDPPPICLARSSVRGAPGITGRVGEAVIRKPPTRCPPRPTPSMRTPSPRDTAIDILY
ncbi:hypothetical protein E2562_013144 [Oryza meyeriana var. granulata]|uniref:Uncharacterized protein n=1 Tax=Oryza meyeriana var. granulata TaxID=110450 RepID=A0A6G1F7Q5_9ORYZ|nr:hypothetical protein E2562_013144 [Oryza meyeriana var. granulata]